MIIRRFNPIRSPQSSQGFLLACSAQKKSRPGFVKKESRETHFCLLYHSRPPLCVRAAHDLRHGCCSKGGGSSARPASSGFLVGDEERETAGSGSSGRGEDVSLRRLATELCREMPASKSFQSYLGRSLTLLTGLSAVLMVANDAVRPDLLASDFLIIAVLVDSASISRSSAVIFRFLVGFSQAKPEPESRRRDSSSCCLRRRRFEYEMTTNAVQAPSVKRAATAASIIHIRVESVVDVLVLEPVFESDGESRGVRVRRSEGIVAVSAQLAGSSGACCVCVSECVFLCVRTHEISW